MTLIYIITFTNEREVKALETNENIEILNPYGFIYITSNMINGKQYIGQRRFKNNWQDYLGSGVLLKEQLRKYGKENFTRKIIAIAYSRKELNDLEVEFIKNHSAVNSGDYYNLSSGGGGGTYNVKDNEFKKRQCGFKIKDNIKKIAKLNIDNYDFIKLPCNIHNDINISNTELTILALMYRNYIEDKGISLCSINMIVKLMRFDAQKNHDIIPIIKDAITKLIDKSYIIEIYDLYSNNITTCDINKDTLFYVKMIKPPEENYFIVYDREINYILQELESEKISKFNIIRYFISCCRFLNTNRDNNILTQDKVRNLVNDLKTFQKYNAILQDKLKLIKFI